MSNPTTITITLDLDAHLANFIGYDGDGEPIQEATTVEDVIIMLAARQVAERAMTGGRDFASDLRHYAVQVRDRVLAEKFEPMLEEAIHRSFQPTNDYGVPRGEPTTLHEVIVEQVALWLNRQDRSLSGRGGDSPLQKFVAAEVHKAMTSELKGVVDTAKAEVLAAVQAKGAEVLAKTITAMAGSKP